MDFESSSKFISSLAKFLQSLCNGYVEFNSGVEVIGHIYLSVDTGKKIDYILNEKVCKTDENSVTFISNSFHAQPAEKPKPPQKTVHASDPSRLAESAAKADEEDIIIMDEPESKNTGTVPSRDSFKQFNASQHSKGNRPSKRSFNQSFPSSQKHSAKQSRSDFSSSGSLGAQLDSDSLHPENNTSSNFLPSQLANDATLMAATESDISHLSKVFPQTFNDSINSQNTAEERDVKPQLDNEMKVVQVKQEYDQSEQGGEEDQESYEDPQDQGSAYPSMPYDQYCGEGSRRGQRSDYSHIAGMAQNEYIPGSLSSGDAVAGDSSGTDLYKLYRPRTKRASIRTKSLGSEAVDKMSTNPRTVGNIYICEFCQKVFTTLNHYEGHKNANHLNLKPYKCEICGKEFAHKNSLTFHRRCCRMEQHRVYWTLQHEKR